MNGIALELHNGTQLLCPIRRSARARRVRMVVSNGQVELIAPLDAPASLLDRFARAQLRWLEGALRRQPASNVEAFKAQTGSIIALAGTDLELVIGEHALKRSRVTQGPAQLRIDLSAQLAEADREEAARQALRSWLSAEAEIHAQRYVARLSPQIGVNVSGVGIRLTRSRWGSCSSSGKLMFNRLLIHAPAEVFEYVVAHELAHRREMNHSPRFWAWVAKLTPNYQRWEDYLDQEGRKLYRFSF